MGLTGLKHPRIGLVGGTFDPVHVGHLALARAARDALGLASLRWLPAGRPWQKTALRTAAEHRVAMLRIALAAQPDAAGWSIDTRECDACGPTVTADTLAALRAELGPDPALVLVLGADQLHNLHTWRTPERLFELAHLAVTQRPGHRLEGFAPEVEAIVAMHGRDALPDTPAGSLVFFRMPAVPVSATALRAALARGERPTELIPSAVLDYIESHHLYR